MSRSFCGHCSYEILYDLMKDPETGVPSHRKCALKECHRCTKRGTHINMVGWYYCDDCAAKSNDLDLTPLTKR